MLEFFFVCNYIEYIKKRNDQEEPHEVHYRHLLLRHEIPLPCWKIVAWILGQVTWLPFKEAGRIEIFFTAYGPKAKKKSSFWNLRLPSWT